MIKIRLRKATSSYFPPIRLQQPILFYFINFKILLRETKKRCVTEGRKRYVTEGRLIIKYLTEGQIIMPYHLTYQLHHTAVNSRNLS
jgi:hypothetical protein